MYKKYICIYLHCIYINKLLLSIQIPNQCYFHASCSCHYLTVHHRLMQGLQLNCFVRVYYTLIYVDAIEITVT